jgi:hypothetical protein
MGRRVRTRRVRVVCIGLVFLLGGLVTVPTGAMADEDGISFWVPGTFGSLAAAPLQPGWAFAAIDYYDSVKAGGDVARAREITVGTFTTNLSANVNANLNSHIDFGLLIPSYVFETRFLGAQAAVQMLTVVGRVDTTLQGTLAGSLGPFGFTGSGSRTDVVTGFGDLYPMFTLRWNEGLNNFMAYVTGDLPVGLYNPTSLSNIGIGHYALDGGVGYTYFDPQTGHELSAVAGLTHNYINPYTQYQNGLDFHLDWGAAQFVTKQWLVGAVGYVYNQLTGDSGSGDHVGPFESRVVGIGPQIGYLFPAGNYQGYMNLKGYVEFDAHDRLSGHNVWLTLSISVLFHDVSRAFGDGLNYVSELLAIQMRNMEVFRKGSE